MVCEKVAKMTQMRHDNLANALRLVVSACSCQSAAEPRYRALAGKKGMVECQRRGDIVAVLPRLELAAVDVVVAHASAKSYAAEAQEQRRRALLMTPSTVPHPRHPPLTMNSPLPLPAVPDNLLSTLSVAM